MRNIFKRFVKEADEMIAEQKMSEQELLIIVKYNELSYPIHFTNLNKLSFVDIDLALRDAIAKLGELSTTTDNGEGK